MSVGLLLVTHGDIGSALLEAATRMLGRCPLQAETLSVSNDSNVELVREQAQGMLSALDQGDGVLVLTDMYGSTPSNIATGLQQQGNIRVVSGINLPMLVRVLNYSQLHLDGLADKAISGGHDGILSEDRSS